MLPKVEDYKIEVSPLEPKDGGGFLATFPELSGCMSDGDTAEEALKNASTYTKHCLSKLLKMA
jgi:predicted RNase H-like HicB family nuclease